MKGYFLSDLILKEDRHQVNGITLEIPHLTPSILRGIVDRLMEGQKKLSATPITEIVDWIDTAAHCLLDTSDAIRQEAETTLPLVSGASKEMVQITLNETFSQLTRAQLLHLLEQEIGDPEILDRFRPRGNRSVHAMGPRLITHLLPGNVAGVSVFSLVFGLLVKSANLARVSREDLLPAFFAQSLHKIRPDLAQNLAILTWDHAAVEITHAAFEKAACAILYGNDETLQTVRKLIPRHITPVLFYGHKLSLGVIAREAIRLELTREAAVDISLYDQRGCLSPHLFYVEELGQATPLQFAKWLAQALHFHANRCPKGTTTPAEAAQIHQLRRALSLKGGQVFVSPVGIEWTVLYDPDPAFSFSPLARTIWIKPVQDLSNIPALLSPVAGKIQAVGIAIPPDRQPPLLTALAQLGTTRICPIGTMQKPPLSWHHDGRFRLADLLHFVDLENG